MFDVKNMKEYHKLFDEAPIAFTIIEVLRGETGEAIDFIFRYANDACVQLEGLTREQMMDQRFFEVFPNADKKWLSIYGETAFTGKKNVVTELSPEIDKTLHIECYQLAEGFCACVLTDVTEEVRRRQALDIAQESYQITLNSSGVRIWEYDLQKDCAYQNIASQQQLGIPAVMQNYPQSFLDTNILLPEYWEQYLEIHRQLKKGLKMVMFEAQMWLPGGEMPVWEKVIYRTIFDKNGVPIKAIGVSLDITEQKHLAEAFSEFTQYQALMAATRLDAFKINVTKDTVIALKDSIALLDGENHKLTMTEFFQKSLRNVPDSRDKIAYSEIYTREKMLAAYERGNKNAMVEVRYDVHGQQKKWLRLHLSMTRHPVTRDIIGVTYSDDITEQKLNQAAVSCLVNNNFDLIMRINACTGQYHVVEHAVQAGCMPELRGENFEEEAARFCREYVVEAEHKDLMEQLQLWTIIKQLNAGGRCVYYCQVYENGETRRKKLQIYYIDKEAKQLCLARVDVTDAKAPGQV